MTLRNAFENLLTKPDYDAGVDEIAAAVAGAAGTGDSTEDRILLALKNIITKLPWPNAAGEARTVIQSGTVTTVTTVTTVSNITSAGGFRMDLSQMAAINAAVAIKRRNITVS
jgi:hypothetical protein